jgi:endo-1,4-beta-xylanase
LKPTPTLVTWSVRDASNNLGTATQNVTIVDTKPPTISVKLSPAVLWPPDHKLVPITASITVEDKCDPNPTVKLLSITSNEPDNGLGDGGHGQRHQGGAIGTDDRTFLLRAERSGLGSGRVYTVIYEAKDASGNASTGQATVTVPKSQSR